MGHPRGGVFVRVLAVALHREVADMTQPCNPFVACQLRSVVTKCVGALLVVLGMAGLYLSIEYSGWVLFVGCATVAT